MAGAVLAFGLILIGVDKKGVAMARVAFTPNIQRHVACPPMDVVGASLAEALGAVFAANPAARGYILDDQGALRKHIAVYIDGALARDRAKLTDPITQTSEIFVFQALSGG